MNPAKAFAHGMVGGVSSVLQGGKFGHGFVSAGLTKWINVNTLYGFDYGLGHTLARVSMAAIIGGTISEATGGKFANGATTAAMGQLFNGENDKEIKQKKMEKYAEAIYKQYPSLKKHGIKVVYEEDVDGDRVYDENGYRVGKQAVGHADIETKTIYVEETGSWDMDQANILHEMLHIDEAVHRGLTTNRSFFLHEFFLDGGHDSSIDKFEFDYYRHLRFEGVPAPDIDGLPWRK